MDRDDRIAIGFCLVAIAAALVFLPGVAGWGVAAGVAVGILVGGLFWASSSEQHDTRGEIGKLLLFGLAAALPSLIVSHAINERQASLEDAFKARQRAQDLQLQIGFQGSLRGVNLSGRDLSDFQLPGRDLEGADLRGATLARANLEEADLVDARLDGAVLDGADLTHADLSGATLAGASLRGAALYSAKLEDACFAPQPQPGRSARPSDLRGARLAGADLHGASFAGADLRGATFTEDLRDARDLDDAVLIGARTAGAAFPPTRLDVRRAPFHPPSPPALAIPPDAREDVVDEVSDGDTVLLRALGKVELLGVAAPSVLDDPTGRGRAAQRFVRAALPRETPVRYETVPALDENGQVEYDEQGRAKPRTDPFGRTFAYVWRTRPADGAAGWFANERLVALGYARTAPLAEQLDDPMAQALRAAVVEARRAAHGVWSTCAG